MRLVYVVACLLATERAFDTVSRRESFGALEMDGDSLLVQFSLILSW